MWRKYFILKAKRFVIPGLGEFDEEKEMREEKLLAAYNRGCGLIKLTEEGEKKYFPKASSGQLPTKQKIKKHKTSKKP
jgi:hypothetical protein